MRRGLSDTCTAITGLVFLYAGFTKTINLTAFVAALEGYGFGWPAGYVHLAIAALPWSEVGLGVAVLLALAADWPRYRRITLWAAILFLLVFLGVIVWGIRHHDILSCGCFGGLGASPGSGDVIRDVIFLAIAGIGLLMEVKTGG